MPRWHNKLEVNRSNPAVHKKGLPVAADQQHTLTKCGVCPNGLVVQKSTRETNQFITKVCPRQPFHKKEEKKEV